MGRVNYAHFVQPIRDICTSSNTRPLSDLDFSFSAVVGREDTERRRESTAHKKRNNMKKSFI